MKQKPHSCEAKRYELKSISKEKNDKQAKQIKQMHTYQLDLTISNEWRLNVTIS